MGGVRVEWNRRSAALMPLGFDKGAAIRFLRGLLSPEAVVAVGDAENDIPMLREADVPVAVGGNAEPAVKAVAKRVVREDGLGVIDVLNMVREWGGKAF